MQHFDLYELLKSKLANKCEYPVSGSVRFRPEQISAVTDSVLEQRQLDRVITIYNIMTGQFFSPSLLKKLKC